MNKSFLGGVCSDDSDCFMPHQVCDAASLVCKCEDGFGEDRGACSPILGKCYHMFVCFDVFLAIREI